MTFRRLTALERNLADKKYPGKGYKYISFAEKTYYSPRYLKPVTIKKGMMSDGATNAIDADTDAWGFHDVLCESGLWDDGTKCTNWQASNVLRDILNDDFRNKRNVGAINRVRNFLRPNRWFIATFLFGGDKARKNGMW